MAKRRPQRSRERGVAAARDHFALRAAILVVAGLLAYWPALSSPFLFDDQTAIVDNLQIRWLTFPEMLSPPRDTPVAGRPLVNMSFALSYAAADGLNPREFRIVNLAIHLLAGVILFGALRRILRLPTLAGQFGSQATNLAFAVALLWTLHPLNTEVVDYLAERTESMMGVFYLATVYCSLRALPHGGTRQRTSLAWSIAAVLLCGAGMLCKESMVTAPIAVALLDRILAFDSWRASVRARRWLYAGLASTWLVLIALLAGTPRTSAGFGSGVSPVIYLLNQARMIVQYLKLAAWPRSLVLDYGLPQPLGLADVLLPGIVVVALLAATIVALAKRPALGLLGAWFFITLAPTSSFVPITTEVGAERRMYLPLIALVVLAVITVERLLRVATAAGPGTDVKGNGPVSGLFRWVGGVALAVVCAMMIAGIIRRGREYASPLSMAQTIVERWPNGRGRYLFGTELIDAGRQAEGMAQLRESARDYPGALFAIGTEELAAGDTVRAIDTLQRFIRAMPNHVTVIPARDMLGRAYATRGDLAAAEGQARQIVQAAPGYLSGHDLLARVLAGQRKYAAAADEFDRVSALDVGNAEARQNAAAMRRLAAGK